MWKYYQIFQVGILIQIPGKKTPEDFFTFYLAKNLEKLLINYPLTKRYHLNCAILRIYCIKKWMR